ncbi:MAG: LysR family transcriptional regulator [Granulosicoccaceae bacterium]
MKTDTSLNQMPLLELDLLKTIVAIAETGNFSAAATVVHRTPSAVSMQVKRVEEMLGRPIFNRDSRSVQLTAEGGLLLEHGRRVLSLNKEIMTRFMSPEVSGVVRLGATDDVAERYLPDLLRRFAQIQCCVTVDVVVDNSSVLEERIRNGDMDLVLVTCDPYKPMAKDTELIHRERLVWAGVQNGVAFEQNPLPISVWEEGCSWRNAGLDSLKEISKAYRVAFMSAHISGQRAAILADLAIAPVPASACVNGLVELTEKQGLPGLRDYGLGMIVHSEPTSSVTAAAQHMRESFSILAA